MNFPPTKEKLSSIPNKKNQCNGSFDGFMAEKKSKTEEQSREECIEYLKKEWNDQFDSLAAVHLS